MAFSGTGRGVLDGLHIFSLSPVNQDHDSNTSRICLSDSASHAGFIDIGHDGRKAYVRTPKLISIHSHDVSVNLGLTMREQKPHCQLLQRLRQPALLRCRKYHTLCEDHLDLVC